ncbi:MAG: hypothetical protein E7E64_05035 [Clostridium celatum]|uniref:hypothetical protein n=1 Tax=Clostridium tertium TaxID=1559 RepID=UPI0029018EB0|nr:hypothetical protein [Clostridium celatum]
MIKDTHEEYYSQISEFIEKSGIKLSDLLSIINIHCKSLLDLKNEQAKNKFRYAAYQINDDNWKIIDTYTKTTIEKVDEELMAYRKAIIYSTVKSKITIA